VEGWRKKIKKARQRFVNWWIQARGERMNRNLGPQTSEGNIRSLRGFWTGANLKEGTKRWREVVGKIEKAVGERCMFKRGPVFKVQCPTKLRMTKTTAKWKQNLGSSSGGNPSIDKGGRGTYTLDEKTVIITK